MAASPVPVSLATLEMESLVVVRYSKSNSNCTCGKQLRKISVLQILMSVRMALTAVMRMQSVPILLGATPAPVCLATLEMERVAIVRIENTP